ncbi:hypothetical protein BXT84_09230 [Sulfobacillus thermotolerans]|uniref:Uncharacterized protein n=1 Tax=Sulfobacillus thermotolerans TaxID=338644 RepID=A0ABM6RS15_9FIRM|nr:hypothetical protein BXT84_09230 [Sulfobacillus thermotolerans]
MQWNREKSLLAVGKTASCAMTRWADIKRDAKQWAEKEATQYRDNNRKPPALTEAHEALGRLIYVGWIPGVGEKFHNAAATVNGVYWTAAGIEGFPLSPANRTLDSSSLVASFLHH